jgi:hypothetical protein
MSCSGEMLRDDIEHQLRRQLATRFIDSEARKRGDQTGLDTLVVHALNDGYSTYAIHCVCLSESIKYPTWEVRPQG